MHILLGETMYSFVADLSTPRNQHQHKCSDRCMSIISPVSFSSNILRLVCNISYLWTLVECVLYMYFHIYDVVHDDAAYVRSRKGTN